MQISHVKIENFRCIESVQLELGGTTVIIGENNSGKTSVLDAIKVALGRKWGRSGQTGFHEYDFRSAPEGGVSDTTPISITLEFSENQCDTWPEDVVADLNDIVRVDPHKGRNSIALQVNCSFEQASKSVEPEWKFLNFHDVPFSGKGARNQNFSNFFNYVPCFSMAALRDASTEFGGRSRFWGALLKSVNIDPTTSSDLEQRFAKLNAELLAADPRLDKIKDVLRDIKNVIASGAASDVDVRAVPLKLWEIISRSELLVQGAVGDPWLPIGRHGQGTQSLAVIFLFRAFVELMLAESYAANSSPILLLEEPEAHLHPQACRALWEAINSLPGQKIVTTHSPYFVQNVPLKDLVIIRREEGRPSVSKIRSSFVASVPRNPKLGNLIATSSGKYDYDKLTSQVICNGAMTQSEFKVALMCYTSTDERVHHAALRKLKEESVLYIDNNDIVRLEGWAKRIRGEIFFAKKWILCEGQAEYALMGAIGEKLGCNIDASGISVIDYQNNGSPGAFAALARALRFEWAMICDGDGGGDDHITQLRSKQFSEDFIKDHVVQLPRGYDLEKFIISGPLRPLMLAAVQELNATVLDQDEAILDFARKNKEEVAMRLSGQIRASGTDLKMPEEFKRLFAILGVNHAQQ